MLRTLRATVVLAVLCAAPSLASAHISLTSPQKRYDSQKAGPCGLAGGQKTDKISVFKPGETITVTWNETINHPGHYRISFDADGDDDFVDPASFTDTYSAPSVLLDDIADKAGGSYSAQVTLPNIECETCTLQLIQVMTDKAPYGDGNDIYYQCADIALRADSDAGAGGAAGAGGGAGTAGGGGTTSSGGTTASGGSTSGGGAPAGGGSAGTAGTPSSSGDDDGGCSCRVAPRAAPTGLAALAALAGVLALGRRRARAR